MTPTPDEMRSMAERLEGRISAEVLADAAAMLRAIADDAEQWVDVPRLKGSE